MQVRNFLCRDFCDCISTFGSQCLKLITRGTRNTGVTSLERNNILWGDIVPRIQSQCCSIPFTSMPSRLSRRTERRYATIAHSRFVIGMLLTVTKLGYNSMLASAWADSQNDDSSAGRSDNLAVDTNQEAWPQSRQLSTHRTSTPTGSPPSIISPTTPRTSSPL